SLGEQGVAAIGAAEYLQQDLLPLLYVPVEIVDQTEGDLSVLPVVVDLGIDGVVATRRLVIGKIEDAVALRVAGAHGETVADEEGRGHLGVASGHDLDRLEVALGTGPASRAWQAVLQDEPLGDDGGVGADAARELQRRE